MIEFQNFGISFGKLQVYKNLNLVIDDFSRVCLLGKSGCGKSILLKSILRNIEFTGKILINGSEEYDKTRLISTVYQDFCILPWLSIYDNIKLCGATDNEIRKYANLLGILSSLNKLPKEVSIGTKQRAAMVRALCSNKQIMLLDEPLCSVDEITASEIRKSLKKLTQEKTVLFVTHNIMEALEFADRIIVLNFGEIALDCPANSLTYDKILSALL